jgi:UDPglucose 6-dehydrogenase
MRSTLPLGESANLAGWLERASLDGVVTNPEFLRQGTAVADFVQPTRIVFGTVTGEETMGSVAARAIYEGVDAPVIVTGYSAAELIKNAANAYLAMKLSFVNEIADLCEVYGADVEAVVEGIGLDPRIGSSYMRPGIGFGGSCLPKELANMLALGRRRGLPMHTFDAASRSNDERSKRIANRVEGVLGPLNGRRVAMLGLAFKANTDDTRNSPAIALARELIARGALIAAHDPKVPDPVTRAISGLTRVDAAVAAIEGAELVVIATEWPEYQALDWAGLSSRAARPVVFDGRNVLDRSTLEQAGWQVIRVGGAVPGPVSHENLTSST